MVFNGEIFNYIELRDDLKSKGIEFTSSSDSEVLLKMYIYYGEACLDYFNGMFAFAIYDNETENILQHEIGLERTHFTTIKIIINWFLLQKYHQLWLYMGRRTRLTIRFSSIIWHLTEQIRPKILFLKV